MKDEGTIRRTNEAAYATEEALDKYSTYLLYPVEKHLVSRYFASGSSILDLACGAGRTTVRLFEMGYVVKGIDLSEMLITAAHKRFPQIRFEVGDFTRIQEREESFDCVLISHNGIDYVYPESMRSTALQECYRVVRRGGILIFSSHNIKSLYFSPFYLLHPKRIFWKLKHTLSALRDYAFIEDLGMHTFYGSPPCIQDSIRSAGFEVVDVVGANMRRDHFFVTMISPHVHYVCRKP